MAKAVILMVAAAFSHSAVSQGLSITDESGAPGATATTSLGYVAQNDLSAISVDIFFDETVITPQVDNPADAAPTVTGCLATPGGNWSNEASSCRRVAADQIRLVFASGFAATAALDTANPFGSITWDIAGDAAIGTVAPITVQIDSLQAAPDGGQVDDSNLTIDEGSVTVACPVGESCYQSVPSVGSIIDFGSAIVNDTTASQVITVSNAQDDGVNSFEITGASGTNGGATIVGTVPGGTATVDADGGATEVDVSFECTPTARGDQAGTLEIANDSDNQAPSADYDYTCTGLSPNVAVDGPDPLTGSTADATGPTDVITVTNDQDGFTSTAEDVTATAGAGDTEITVTGGPMDIAPDGSFNFDVACDNTTADTYSRDIEITWTDPVGSGSTTVTVECTISDVAPGYTSDPAVPGPLAFGTVENGASSTLTIDIGNEDSIGAGAGAELDITGAVLSDTTNYSIDPASPSFTLAAGAANGTESIDVSCNPQSIGDFSGATLTVETNDGDQVYTLNCEGTSNAELEVTPAGAVDGTLNLGSVPPGTSAFGSLTISNSGTDPLEVSCTLSDNNGGVISATPDPIVFTIPPDDGTIDFEGSPTGVSGFQETLECTVTDPSDSSEETFTTTITVSGRPLIVPTMSPLGLIVMSLMLLLVAGFAGRRMMA